MGIQRQQGQVLVITVKARNSDGGKGYVSEADDSIFRNSGWEPAAILVARDRHADERGPMNLL